MEKVLISQRIILVKFFILLIVILFVTLPVISQSKYIVYPTNAEQEFKGLCLRPKHASGRPKVGLVLSGGGARGLAQVGVIKVLEKYHIPIDVVVGNSLGSVIGGMYASGYTTSEIESIAIHTNWTELLSFSEETKRTDLFVGQKESQAEGYLIIRFDGLQPIIPSSISGGQRLSNFFTTVTLQALYHPNPTFDELKIPFRAVATDLLRGNRVVLDHGSLAEAMRASITVPLLYSPLVKDSTLLVDGGLTTNIPVDVAKSLGCDVVIVVNSTSPMRSKEQMNAPWEIADQIMTIMMQEENKRQLQLADIVFTPDVGNRIVSDFSGIEDIITAGEKQAENGISQIQQLLHSSNDSSGTVVMLKQPQVSFTGDAIPEDIVKNIQMSAQNQTLTLQSIRQHLNEIASTNLYCNIQAEVTEMASPSKIVYHATHLPVLNNIVVSGKGKTLIPHDVFARELDSLQGKLFDVVKIQHAIEKILVEYRQRGYSLATIDSVALNPIDNILSIGIHEGRIGQVKYEGNERTRDYILRRELPFNEGEVFNVDAAYRGMVNIKSTGLFEYVLLDVQHQGEDHILVVKVKEKSSELLRIGVHADNEHEVVSTVDIGDVNFRGAWEDLGLRLRYGFRDRLVQIDYTINRIFHSYFTFNMKGYFKSRDIITYGDDPTLTPGQWDRIEEGRFKENKYGWSMTFGSHFERFGDVTAQLRIENHKIASISGQGYSPERYNFVGVKIQSTVDTEDKYWFPTEGMHLAFSYESATKSLGSEVGFGKISFEYETYLTLMPHHTLRPKLIFGFADATLPIAEQFSLGGFHSFFGLREDDSRGRQLFLTSLEYRFNLPFNIIFPTYVKARYDLGTISLLPEELKFNSFRHGLGVEVSLDSPLGAVSFGAGKSFYFRRELPNSPVTVGPLLLYFSLGSSL